MCFQSPSGSLPSSDLDNITVTVPTTGTQNMLQKEISEDSSPSENLVSPTSNEDSVPSNQVFMEKKSMFF